MMEVDSIARPAPHQDDEEGEDLYLKMKELQSKLEMMEIQEQYIKNELNHLKSEEARSKDEVSACDDLMCAHIPINYPEANQVFFFRF